jgi:hypothetical protein
MKKRLYEPYVTRALASIDWKLSVRSIDAVEGVLRVAGTRVALNSIVAAFDLGAKTAPGPMLRRNA